MQQLRATQSNWEMEVKDPAPCPARRKPRSRLWRPPLGLQPSRADLPLRSECLVQLAQQKLE